MVNFAECNGTVLLPVGLWLYFGSLATVACLLDFAGKTDCFAVPFLPRNRHFEALCML
jgi:hypothetical protein